MDGAVEAPEGTLRPGLTATLRAPTWGLCIGLFIVAAGWAIGLRPLADNSFLTHLATGRLILDTDAVPSSDPYTFTAAGEPWVVQSWLASVVYAGVEGVAGLDGVRVLFGLQVALLTGLGWRLLAPAESLVARLLAAGLFVGVGASLWAERPFMVGLILLALVALASEDRFDARWLLPLGWIWVNTHGSFPLGVALLVVSALGRRLDQVSASAELRALRWLVPGLLLGAVGPLGLQVLLFPVELLSRQDVLQHVVEWRAPTFDTTSQRLFVLQLGVAILAIARRPSYRAGLLVAVFGGAALLSMRNVAVASLVFLPAMAPGLAGIGTLSSLGKPKLGRPILLVGVAVFALLTFARSSQADLRLTKYPVPAFSYLEGSGIDTQAVRLAAPDFVGNFVEYVYGAERRAFYDDRFDMFPADVTEAQQALLLAAPDLREWLDEFDIDLVLVRNGVPTGQILALDPSWRTLYIDPGWVLTCRRGVDLGGSAGTC